MIDVVARIHLSHKKQGSDSRQQQSPYFHAHSRCCWRVRRRAGGCLPIVRLRFLCRASVAAEAGPDNPVDALACQDVDILVVILAEGIYVTEGRERAPGGTVTGDGRVLGAAEGDQTGGVVPTALRGLRASPHG